MARTKLAYRQLPDYTRGEERFNMISHIVGGGVAIAATVACLIMALLHRNWIGLLCAPIYGGSMIALYTMSSIYHGLRPHLRAKKVFQVLDHCTIYFMIAGTYTPFSLCALRALHPALGWGIFGGVWALAALGITLNAIDLRRYRVISMVLYLAMGWCIIFTAPQLFGYLGVPAAALLVSGGVSYTVGAILYGLGKKHRYMHSVFHLFVVAGSILHALCIVLYLM